MSGLPVINGGNSTEGGSCGGGSCGSMGGECDSIIREIAEMAEASDSQRKQRRGDGQAA